MTPDANGWRSDMENAPDDGTFVLIYEPEWGVALAGRMGFGDRPWWRQATAEYNNDLIEVANPTHWQPLPAPPVSEGD